MKELVILILYASKSCHLQLAAGGVDTYQELSINHETIGNQQGLNTRKRFGSLRHPSLSIGQAVPNRMGLEKCMLGEQEC